jgi:hypothetical protein
MDTIPLFLQLIQSHTLLFSVIMTGNIQSFDGKYDGKVYYPTEMGVYLSNFKLTENDVFDVVLVTLMPDGTVNVSMFTDSSKYYDNPETYFGTETIYSQIEYLFNEKGIKIKHPFQYVFRDFVPPVFILSEIAVTGYYVHLSFGDAVLKMRVLKRP